MKVKAILLSFMFLFFHELAAQKSTIRGKVIESNGDPVVGASVVEVGTTNGTMTNATGEFTLVAGKANPKIRISSIGYKTEELEVTSSPVTITLAYEDSRLDELVVTGYSTQKQGEISASIVKVSQKELKDVKSPNVSNLLQGKIAGVNVVNSTGRPGDNATIRIRGRSSISSSSDPLWVVDGVIAHGTPNINPNDIETVSVLKDAAATTQYGSRGANGVIVITTRRAAASGSGTFTVNIASGASHYNQGNFKLMNSQQMWDYYQTFTNPNAIPAGITPDVLKNNYDWLANGTQAGQFRDISGSYMGKTDKTSFYASGNYYKEEGSVKGYVYDRLTARMNIDHKLTDKLTFKPKINASFTSTDSRQHSLYDMYLNMPWDAPYSADGKILNPQAGGITWYGRDNRNYLYDQQFNYGKGETFDIQSNFDFSYRINDQFSLESMNNLAYYTNTGMSYTDPQSNSGLANKGSVSQSSNKRIVRFFNQMLKYGNSFGKHDVSAFLAYEYSDYVYSSVGVSGKGIAPGSQIIDNAADFLSKDGTKNDYAFQSGIFQVNYGFSNRYNLQASYRLDGSSRFGESKRYGSFYAVSGAWNIHNEDFFKVKAIDNLRLRLSYGEVGNVPTGLYSSYSLYSLSGQYNGQPAAIPGQYENPLVSWEKSKDVNLGLEFGLLNRLDFTLDLYNKNTDGLLTYITFPSTAGWSGYYQNVGSVQNKGVEFSVNASLLGKDSPLSWSAGFNIAHNKNRINSLKDGVDIPAGNKRYSEGRDIDSWYMRKWAGVNPENGAPQWEVINATTGEVTLTSNYNTASLQFVGTSTPKFQGGFNTQLGFKGLSLSTNLAFLKGAYAYHSARELFDSDGAYPTYNQIAFKDGWSRWSASNPDATHPAASYNNTNASNKTSSRYLEDASFLRLRNVTLSYDIAAGLVQKLKLKSANLYVSGDNLWISTPFSGVDPEAALYGDATSQYASPKRFSFGLNVSF